MLVAEDTLTTANLGNFFTDYLRETGTLEAAYCRAAHRLATAADPLSGWLALNYRLDALKSARESRQASASLGRRFLQLAAALDQEQSPLLEAALQVAKRLNAPVHHCAAFGLFAGTLGIDAQTAAAAYLHQTIAGLIAACQRLMPLGQQAASKLLWSLKPAMIEAAAHGADDPDAYLSVYGSEREVFTILEPYTPGDATPGKVEVRSSYLVPIQNIPQVQALARRGQETLWPVLNWSGQYQQMLHGKAAQSMFVWTAVWDNLGVWEQAMANTGGPEFQTWFTEWKNQCDFGGPREIFRNL